MLWLLAAGLMLLGPTPDQLQAQERLKEGQRLMTSEKFEAAAQAFREAIELDPLLTMAHYGLGQSNMALKQYPSAVIAFRGAREAFQKRVAEGNTRRMEDAAAREDRIRALRDQIREMQEQQVTGTGPAAQRTAQQRDQRISEWELQIQTLLQSQSSGSKPPEIPPGLALALGSAHFRSGQLAEAEREYRAALILDPKLGEPRNNLAVVLLLTGRPAEAKEQLAAAERNGYKVSAGLKKDVESALAGGSNTPRP
jgi:tetratricopeptide (TPR) repeat protein